MTNFWNLKQEDGGLIFSDYQIASFHEYCKDNPKKTFKLSPVESLRTLSQNKLYWLYLGVIERETGNNASDLHEYFKRKLLPPKFIHVFGKEVKIPSSSTDLKKHEFGEYMDKICAETNIPIPVLEGVGEETIRKRAEIDYPESNGEVKF